MQCEISVIIPVYNSEKTIERCISSILSQTFYAIEIIAIDDGSTDSSGEIIDRLANETANIKVFHQKNLGQASARNLGLSHATGKYIGFVDSDDTIDPTMYEIMLNKIKSTNAQIVQCSILKILPDSRYSLGNKDFENTIVINDRKCYFSDFLFPGLHSYECCNKLFLKSLFDENNIVFFDNNKVYAEDLLFNLDCIMSLSKIVFIRAPLYHYFQNPNSHSKVKTETTLICLCNLFEIFQQHTKEKQLYDKLKYEISKFALLIIFINLASFLSSGGNIKFVKEFLQRKDIKKHLKLSTFKMKKLRQNVIIFLIRFMPLFIKIAVIKFYYSRW